LSPEKFASFSHAKTIPDGRDTDRVHPKMKLAVRLL
jgi:hypothetical protein